MRTSLTLFRSP
uniref:Uncharacterized protein n=1 Tax=Lepeophtheirus salmonis TaxID=72036 RepID=A0A0K2V881_LEPSM